MKQEIQAIRGMNDVLPPDTFIWQHVEHLLRTALNAHGYHEIRFPILEKTELFKRTIGEATDIVEKEMYTFLDRNQDSLSLRPEGTASCVRACIEHGLLRQSIQRLWYMGPFFRHERPQKGRYRQFHQLGAEVFGTETPDVDAELIVLSAHLLKSLKLYDHVTLHINTLGSADCRKAFRKQLQDYFFKHENKLDKDSKRRLHTNPFRILDSKNPDLKTLIEDAPKLLDCLMQTDEASFLHFETLKRYLTDAHISFEINPKLVRGLDYYSRTVFEWITDHLGAQGTVCGGGRYDQLIEQLGGTPTPAIGFALGLERAVLLYQELYLTEPLQPKTNVYVMSANEMCFGKALEISDRLRSLHNRPLNVILHCGGGSFKNQFKKADKSSAEYAVMIGDEELQKGMYSLKDLKAHQDQKMLSYEELIAFFSSIVSI